MGNPRTGRLRRTTAAGALMLTLAGCASAAAVTATTADTTSRNVTAAGCTAQPTTLNASAASRDGQFIPSAPTVLTICTYRPVNGISGTLALTSTRRILAADQVRTAQTLTNTVDTTQQNLHCSAATGAIADLIFDGPTYQQPVTVSVDLSSCHYESLSASQYGGANPALLRTINTP